MKKRSALSRLLDVLFPPKCVGCGEVLERRDDGVFCYRCRAKWEMAKYRVCAECGNRCFRCRCAEKIMYAAGIRTHMKLVFYESGSRGVVKSVLYRAKKNNNSLLFETLGNECAKLIINYLSERDADYSKTVITYPPRPNERKCETGYDQSYAIAKVISDVTQIELAETMYRRGGKTQKKLDREARTENARNSLFPTDGLDLSGKTVILFDDVVTTGATSVRAADILYGAGASEVVVVSVAKSVFPSQSSGK